MSDSFELVQDAIDKLVNASQSLETTSGLLRTDIARVDAHNDDILAHPYIRNELAQVPHTTMTPSVSGPRSVQNNVEYTFTLVSSSTLANTEITKFHLELPDGSTQDITEGIVNGSVTIPLTFTGDRFAQQVVLITAYDQNNVASATYSLAVQIYYNDPPVLDGLTCTGLPVYTNPGDVLTITLIGLTDVDIPYGDIVSMTIQDTDLTFDKVTDIHNGDTLQLTVDSEFIRGSSHAFTVVATDSHGAQASKVFSLAINQLPVMTNFTHTVPALINPNSITSVTFSGATDPDNQTVVYDLDTISEGLSFSKTSDIAANEAVTMTAADLAVGTELSFKVYARDTVNGTAVSTIQTKINTPPNIASITHTLPSILIPGQVYPLTISGGSDIDGNLFTYSLTCTEPTIELSKVAGITDGEECTLTVPSAIIRGLSFSIHITATDNIGGISSTTIVEKINTLPDVTNLIFPLATILTPNTAYPFVLHESTDIDVSQTVTYSLSCNDPNITFSKTTGILDNEEITCTLGEVDRGSTITFNCDITDGLETIHRTYPRVINNLPDISELNQTIPAIIKPTDSLLFTITGITDADSQTLSYSLVSDDPAITFSKTTDISLGSNVTLTASGATRGNTVTITATVTDGLEEVIVPITTNINSLPGDPIAYDIPAVLIPDTIYSISFNDTDSDNQTLTYSVACDNVNIGFYKTTGIATGESVTMTVGAGIARGIDVNFTITVSDGLETVQTIATSTTNVLPQAATLVFNNLPDICKPGTDYTVSLSGGTSGEVNQSITYSLTSDNPKVTLSKASGLVNNEAFTLTVSNEIARNVTVGLTVIASDGLETTSRLFTTKVNTLPDASGFSHNLPGIVAPNRTVPFSMQGVSDIDGQTLSYSISSNKTYLSFSKDNDISPGEIINLIVDTTAVRNETATLTVTITDGLEITTKTITTKINQLPSTELTSSYTTEYVVPGTNYSWYLYSSDPDNQTTTMSISSSDPGITFSKSTGLTNGESFSVIVSPDIIRGTVVTLTVTISDGLETSTATFITKVNRLPTKGITINGLPTYLVPDRDYTISFTGAGSGDSGQSYTYGCTSSDGNITFSKSVLLTEGEQVTMHVGNAIVRGTTVTFTVTISDSLEESVTLRTAIVNTLPVVDSMICNLPTYVIPGGVGGSGANGIYSNCKLSSIANNDAGQTLTCSISCNDPGVSFSKASGLAVDEIFDIIIGGSVVRGTLLVFTVTVSDGLETRDKVFTSTAAILATPPTITGVPETYTGGQTLTFTLGGSVSNMPGTVTRYYLYDPTLEGAYFTINYEIQENGTVNFVLPKVAENTSVTIYAMSYTHMLDATGGWLWNDWSSASISSATFTLLPIYVASTPNITSPTDGAVLSSDTFTMTFSPLEVTIDV